MENSPYLVHSLYLHDIWSEQAEFNIIFWLLSTVLFWSITKHTFYLVQCCLLQCFLFCNGKWKVEDYWKFGEMKSKDTYPWLVFSFYMIELLEIRESANFLMNFLLYLNQGELANWPIWWYSAFKKCIQILTSNKFLNEHLPIFHIVLGHCMENNTVFKV